jgi:hypothetical protein
VKVYFISLANQHRRGCFSFTSRGEEVTDTNVSSLFSTLDKANLAAPKRPFDPACQPSLSAKTSLTNHQPKTKFTSTVRTQTMNIKTIAKPVVRPKGQAARLERLEKSLKERERELEQREE